MIRVRLRRSPNRLKKWRVEVLGAGKRIDFGQAGASDFTIHKDPARMLRYLLRHGAEMPATLRRAAKREPARATDPTGATLVQKALDVRSSRRERWGDADVLEAIGHAGFWSRWLLWSLPDLAAAKALIARRFNVEFV